MLANTNNRLLPHVFIHTQHIHTQRRLLNISLCGHQGCSCAPYQREKHVCQNELISRNGCKRCAPTNHNLTTKSICLSAASEQLTVIYMAPRLELAMGHLTKRVAMNIKTQP